MPDETCKNCRFWDHANEGNFTSQCRRFPPQFAWKLGQNGIDFIDGSWPTTWGHDWCGEFAGEMEDK